MIIIGLLFVLTALAFRSGVVCQGGNFVPAVLRKKKLEIDYKYIEKTDKEIFGIDKEIVDLPGYYWAVYLSDFTVVGDYRNTVKEKIKVSLLDDTDTIVSSLWVSKHTDGGLHTGPKNELVRLRTTEELDCAVQQTMEKIANEEVKRVKQQQAIKSVLLKYNGQPVNQDSEVQDK